MPRPFKKKNFRHRLEARLDELATQTDDLRQQVVDRAPGVRDQLVDLLPDKDQLLDLRDDLFEKLPDSVSEKLPEKVKPKRSRLKRIAVIGAVTGAGAAAFAVVRGRAKTSAAPEPYRPTPTPPATPASAPSPTVDADGTPAPAKKAAAKKS